MGLTKKAMILFDPELYRRLEEEAQRRGVSAASVVREAVARYLTPNEEADRQARIAAAERLIARQDDVIEWDEFERLVERRFLGE